MNVFQTKCYEDTIRGIGLGFYVWEKAIRYAQKNFITDEEHDEKIGVLCDVYMKEFGIDTEEFNRQSILRERRRRYEEELGIRKRSWDVK